MSYSPPETAVQEELSLQIGVDELKGQIQPTRRPRISQRFRILPNIASNTRQPKALPFTLNAHGLQIGSRHWTWRDAPLCSMNLCNNPPSVLILHPNSGDELRLTASNGAISWLLQLIEGFKQNVDRDATVPKELLQMRTTQSKGTQPSRNTKHIQQ